MSCSKTCNKKCCRGPIGPQGEQGIQGPTGPIGPTGSSGSFATIRFNQATIPIQPGSAFQEFIFALFVTLGDLISLSYGFEGNLVDIEKIRIKELRAISTTQWRFIFFFSQPTTTILQLTFSFLRYISPVTNLTSENEGIIIESS